MKGRDYDLTFKRWVGICYVDIVIGDSVVKGTALEIIKYAFLIFIYLLHWALVQHVGSGSLTRGGIQVPCIGSMESQPLDQ